MYTRICTCQWESLNVSCKISRKGHASCKLPVDAHFYVFLFSLSLSLSLSFSLYRTHERKARVGKYTHAIHITCHSKISPPFFFLRVLAIQMQIPSISFFTSSYGIRTPNLNLSVCRNVSEHESEIYINFEIF